MVIRLKAKLLLGLYALSTDQLDNLDTALLSMMNMLSFIHFDPLKFVQHQSKFPLEVDISPCSYLSASNVKMRLGVDLDWKDPLMYERVVYPERLTLQEMSFEESNNNPYN